jgi:hypothetical protein
MGFAVATRLSTRIALVMSASGGGDRLELPALWLEPARYGIVQRTAVALSQQANCCGGT